MTTLDLDTHIRSSAKGLNPEDLRAPVLVGVSGGADSLALLHSLRSWSREVGVRLRAVHVDHGLHPDSATHAAQVGGLCTAWFVPFDIVQVDVRAIKATTRRGMEDAAREARYRAFRDVALRHGVRTLVLGHQADDQAETLLLHLVRGAGTTGLGAMRTVTRGGTLFDDLLAVPRDNCGGGGGGRVGRTVWRPLLGVPRAAIDDYCRRHGLAPLHDPSNDDRAIRRNLVRHTLLPAIERGFPGAGAALARTAALTADEDEFLGSLVDERWGAVARVEGELVVIDRAAFRAEHRAIRRRLLRRAWALLRGTTAGLTAAPVDLACDAIVGGRTGARLALPKGIAVALDRREALLGGAAEFDDLLRRRYADRLPSIEPGRVVPVAAGTIVLPAGWRIEVEATRTGALAGDGALSRHIPQVLDVAEDWMLRGWRPGDRVALPGGRQKLQDWFVDHHIPGYLRRGLVLLACGDRVAWIAGLASFALQPGEGRGAGAGRSGRAEWRLRLLLAGAPTGGANGGEVDATR